MSYEKQNWETGEVITADRLNHMEDGIATDKILMVTLKQESAIGTYTADYAYDDVAAFVNAGGFVIFRVDKRTASLQQPLTYYYAPLIVNNDAQGGILQATMATVNINGKCYVNWSKYTGITVDIM